MDTAPPRPTDTGGPTDTDALRDALDAHALAGADWHELLARLAQVTGAHVRLIAADGGLLVDAPGGDGTREPAASTDHDRFHQARQRLVGRDELDRLFSAAAPGHTGAMELGCLDGTTVLAVAVGAGERRVGALAAVLPAPDGVERALRAAANAVAIEAVRRDARAEAVAESAGWLIDELRHGSTRPGAELERLARRHGVRLDGPHAAVGLEYDGPDTRVWTTSLTWLEAPVRADGPRAWTIVAGEAEQVRAEIRWVHERLQPFVRGTVRVAAGSVAVGVEETRRSFELAHGALAVLRHRGDRTTVSYDELGLGGVLLAVPRPQLEAFAGRRLHPLRDRPDLLDTLAAWYATGGSRAAVADALGIHRNSVGYRLDRIRELLGTDPDAPLAATDLRAALAALEVLAATADVGTPPHGTLCSEHERARSRSAGGHGDPPGAHA